MIDGTNLIFNFEKSYHISHNQDYFCCVGTKVNLYNLQDGKLTSKFTDVKHSSCSRFTSNGKLIVKASTGVYYVYDLDTMTLIKKIPPPKKVLSSITGFQITSDNKYIIDFSYIFPTYQLMFIEIKTGEYTFFDLGYCRKAFVLSSETELKYYIVVNCSSTADATDVSIQEIYELSYTNSGFKLQKLFVNNDIRLSAVDYTLNKFVFADYSNKIKFFDMKNNSWESLEYTMNGVLYDLKFAKNGKLLALVESQNVYVYDVIKKICVKTFKVEYGCFADFFDNDTKLLIGTWKKGYCLSLR